MYSKCRKLPISAHRDSEAHNPLTMTLTDLERWKYSRGSAVEAGTRDLSNAPFEYR